MAGRHPDFQKQLDSVFEQHDRNKASLEAASKKAADLIDQRLNQFRDLKSKAIKPALEQSAAKLTERGYICRVSDEHDPPTVGLTVESDNYIGFTTDLLDTLHVQLNGQPMNGAQGKARFGWEESKNNILNEKAVKQAILTFVGEVLKLPPKDVKLSD